MTKLNEEAKKAIAEMRPAVVATAAKSGQPDVSAKGSLRVLDDESVAFAIVASPRTEANIRENPVVCVLCLDAAHRHGCRIWGAAELITSGNLFDEFKRELGARSMTVKSVVRVKVEEVELS